MLISKKYAGENTDKELEGHRKVVVMNALDIKRK